MYRVKFERVVFEIRERKDRQTDTLITILCTTAGGEVMSYQVSGETWTDL